MKGAPSVQRGPSGVITSTASPRAASTSTRSVVPSARSMGVHGAMHPLPDMMNSVHGVFHGGRRWSARAWLCAHLGSTHPSACTCGLPSQDGSGHQNGFQPDRSIFSRRSATSRCSDSDRELKSGSGSFPETVVIRPILPVS